jgi:plastocyanin
MPRHLFALAAATLAAVGFALPALADDVVLTLKDHKFDPAKLELPAGAEHKILVKNLDGTPEEFESESLDIEKVIAGGQEASFTVGPLDPGSYEFYGEFHEDTAQGQIVVK